ncbi:MAG: metal-dependent exonucleaseMrfB [Anaerolineales bacterium]
MNLSARLKALGVQVGAQKVAPRPRQRPGRAIEDVIAGQVYRTPFGETFQVVRDYEADAAYGTARLGFLRPSEVLAAWAEAPLLADYAPEDYFFFDTETTGLAGGGGTYAFLIGAGRFDGDVFRVAQFFLREPGEEAAQLAALSEFAGEAQVWVSFNGRSFDGPLLKTRCTLNGISNPLEGRVHLDLLQLARRLWRNRLPSRTLLTLEAKILGTVRTQEDIPGWVIPRLYLDYLTVGDAALLKNVFYHNEKDVVAMAALLHHINRLLDAPLAHPERSALDLTGIGSVHEKLGRAAEAAALYAAALDSGLPADVQADIRRRLSFLHKRAGAWAAAIALWEQAAKAGEWYACEELAKYYEHRIGDIPQALTWARAALDGLAGAPMHERLTWQAAFEHRLVRLERKARKDEGGMLPPDAEA